MKVVGQISFVDKNKWMVGTQLFTCDGRRNIGVTRNLDKFSKFKINVECWIRDEDHVLLGVKLK
jgi:hypothetical protein